MEMTLVAFLKQFGLLLPSDKAIEQLRALTPEDRDWFRDRAQVEYGITIKAPNAA